MVLPRFTIITAIMSDLATLSSDGFVPTMGVELLQDDEPTVYARTVDVDPANTQFDVHFTEPVACNSIALPRTNSGEACTIEIQGAATQGGLGSEFSTGVLSAWPTSGKPTDRGKTWWDIQKFWEPDDAYPWWRVLIDDNANPANYWQAARLYLGEYIQLGIGVSKGWQWAWKPADYQSETPFGSLARQRRGRPRVWLAPFNTIRLDVARGDVFRFFDEHGLSGDFYAIRDPSYTTDLHRFSMMAAMTEPGAVVQNLQTRAATQFAIRELI